MLKTILEGSLAGRLFAALRAFWPSSVLAGIGRFFKNAAAHSACARGLRRFFSVPDRADRSAAARIRKRLIAGIVRLLAPLRRALDGSLLVRAGGRLRGWLRGSRLFGWTERLGFRRLVILALALYLPIDYVLREVIGISFLASGWDEGMMLLALAVILWRRSSPDAPVIERSTTLGGYVALFLACGFFLMCAVSPYPAIAFAGLRAQVQYILWYFLLLGLMEDRQDFSLFYHGLLAVGLVLCLHGIYQYIVAAPIPASWVTQTEMGVRTRVYSLTGSPNILGSFIVLTAPLAAGLLYRWKSAEGKLAAWGMLGVMCLCVLFTFSRGAWVGAVCAVAVFALLVDGRLLLLLGAGALGALTAVPSIADRITYLFTQDYKDASLKGGRAIRWATGMELLRFNGIWLGFGLGRFGGAVAMQNQVLEKTKTFEYFYLDNYYLKTLVEMGGVGLAFYLLMLLALAVWSLRAIRRLKDSRDYPLVCGIFAGLVGVLAHCLFENIFEVPYMLSYFWMLAALIQFRAKLPSDEKEAEKG